MRLSRTSVTFVLGSLVACWAGVASAQQSQYVLPVERGILESHLDLQYHYSSLSVGTTDFNMSILSLEGQYVFADRFEVGINVPFLAVDNATFGGTGSTGAEIGDILLSGKMKLFSISKFLGAAAFYNIWLPTHTSDTPRDNLHMQFGGAVEASVLGFQAGGGVQIVDNIVSDAADIWMLGLNAYARAPLPFLPLLALMASVEYFNSLAPEGDLNALLITPGLEASLFAFHVGLGVRIAATDDGKAVIGGRLAILANAGVRF